MIKKDMQLLHQVGTKLKGLRLRLGMSLEEVEAATGIAVTQIENGEKDFPIDQLAILCEYYRTSLSGFFREVEKHLL